MQENPLPSKSPVESQNSIYFDIASEAKDVIKKSIPRSATSLEMNSLSAEDRADIIKRITAVKNETRNTSFFNIESIPEVSYFRKSVGKSEKYKVGNCMEMAIAAFFYIVEKHPTVRVEIFQIRGGDHFFAVVNRKHESEPCKPETWGEDAYICDPWANKVFSAKQCELLLDNHNFAIREDGYILQIIEKFDPKRQSLVCGLGKDYDSLAESIREKERLVENYDKKRKEILECFYNYVKRMERFAKKEKGKCKDDNYQLLISKSEEVKRYLDEHKDHNKIDIKNFEDLPYGTFYKELRDKLKTELDGLREIAKFTSEDSRAAGLQKTYGFWPPEAPSFLFKMAILKREEKNPVKNRNPQFGVLKGS